MPCSARLDAEAPQLTAHLDFAATQFADPAVARWHWPAELGGSRSRAEVAAILERQAAQVAAEGFGLWWWRERASANLIGMAGLNRETVAGESIVEVGWSIAPPHWRQGFATEAAIASLRWGFERCGLARIISFTLPENVASRGVMESAGLNRGGDFIRKGFPHVLYEAEAATWQPRRTGSIAQLSLRRC